MYFPVPAVIYYLEQVLLEPEDASGEFMLSFTIAIYIQHVTSNFRIQAVLVFYVKSIWGNKQRMRS